METKLSTRLKALRKNESLTVSEVVRLLYENNLDYSEQSVYKWEEGSSVPSVRTLYILAKIYNCPISFLVADDHVNFKKINPHELLILRLFRTDFLFRSTASLLMRLIDRNNF